MTQPFIAVAMPSGGSIRHNTSLCLARLAAYTAASGISLCFPDYKASDIAQARNSVVRGILETECTHIMWIDADQIFPADGLIHLLSWSLPMVGALYSTREPPYRVVGILKDEAAYVKGGLQEADYLPGGFCLVEMDAYRQMGAGPWYEERYVPELAGEGNPFGFMSDDVHFFRRAREKFGIQCWADLELSAEIGHIGTRTMFIAPQVIGQEATAPIASAQDEALKPV